MRGPDGIRERVSVLLLSMVALVAVLAGAGTVGVTSLTEDVEVVVDNLRPAVYDNIAVRNDMAQAQAALRGWALSGDREFLQRFYASKIDAGMELADLSATLQDDTLAPYVRTQQDSAQEWFSFADEIAGRRPGMVPAASLRDGQAAFDRFVESNDAVSLEVNGAIEARGEEARERARSVLVFVVSVSLLGLVVAVVLGSRFVRRVNGPLREMEKAVERLAAGDLGARVDADGPRELRSMARAVNALAEENQRAREMEEQVVAQLKALDRAKDEFVSTVSHELRTPLTSIGGYIELLEDDFADTMDVRQKQMVKILKRNVDRLRNLIEDLLTLSRVESDAFRTTFDLLDLGHVASDAAHDVGEIASRAGVAVDVCAPAEPILVRGDAGQLSRALLNLLTNAVKFSAPGDRVLLQVGQLDGQAVASVLDHGIGIPATELTTLGTRFFRASNAVEAEIGGTGLGLRIVQTIADNHGGRLAIDSTEGQGTTARLVVPSAREAEHRNIGQPEGITQG
jgi:signal transduction histidine kinase